MASTNMVYNRKTGKFRRKNLKKSRIMKRVGLKRRNKRMKAATKMKIKRAVMKTARTGRTKFGRKVRKR